MRYAKTVTVPVRHATGMMSMSPTENDVPGFDGDAPCPRASTFRVADESLSSKM